MMRTKHCTVWLAAMILATGALAGADGVADVLPYVPDEANVVVGIDLEQVTASPVFDGVYGALDTDQIDGMLTAVEAMTGVRLFRDIHAIVLAGELKPGGKSATYIRGQWNKDQLIALVAANPAYERRETAGVDVHLWRDDQSGKISHAAFLRDDLLIMSDWLDVATYLAETPPAATPTWAGAALPKAADGSPAAAFVLARRPDDAASGLLAHPALDHVTRASAALDSTTNAATVTLTATVRDAAAAPLLAEAAKGLIAVGQLLNNTYAEAPWTVDSSVQGEQVQVRVSIPMDSLVSGAQALQRLARARKAAGHAVQ